MAPNQQFGKTLEGCAQIWTADQSGFTLVEMMIAVAVFAIVMAGVYGVQRSQMRTHYVQQQVVDMDQNVRAAMYLMEREIKLAGLNPTGAGGIGILTADSHLLEFNMDYTGGSDNGVDDDGNDGVDEGDNDGDDNGNGLVDEGDEEEWYDGLVNDPNDASPPYDPDLPAEWVEYQLSNDADTDGINDGGACDLLRNGEILALNIDALNFVYLDEDGTVLATPVADATQIRTIQVALVARSSATASNFLSGHTDTQSYTNEQGDEILPPQNDTFRRIRSTMEVKCRNIGL